MSVGPRAQLETEAQEAVGFRRDGPEGEGREGDQRGGRHLVLGLAGLEAVHEASRGGTVQLGRLLPGRRLRLRVRAVGCARLKWVAGGADAPEEGVHGDGDLVGARGRAAGQAREQGADRAVEELVRRRRRVGNQRRRDERLLLRGNDHAQLGRPRRPGRRVAGRPGVRPTRGRRRAQLVAGGGGTWTHGGA